MTYRLLALDLDGTLLDPYGALTDATREAVAAARRAGMDVVACTGRRYRTAIPLVRELGLTGRVVVNNGAVVKDIDSGETVASAYLSAELYPEALAMMAEAGAPLVYVDRYEEQTDMLIERDAPTHPFQEEYLDDHGGHARTVESLGTTVIEDVIMLSRMADADTLLPLRERVHARFGERVSTHLILNKNYQGHILELFSPASGKWSALARLADAAGIAPEEIAAVGDDANDAEMLRRAGLGIAMGNAVEEAKQAANLVVRSNAEGGAIEAIEKVLLAR
jgi:Cof subfamily protein (haloacid dehalogenase superfamily)